MIFDLDRYYLWLAIFGSVSLIGTMLALIHSMYAKINHPDVVKSATKRVIDFIQDSFASLVQNEKPPNFNIRPKCSAGVFKDLKLLFFLSDLKNKIQKSNCCNLLCLFE